MIPVSRRKGICKDPDADIFVRASHFSLLVLDLSGAYLMHLLFGSM